MSKFVSFTKYKAYLENQGYSQKGKPVEYDTTLGIRDYVFSKEGDENIYKITVFVNNLGIEDNIVSIYYGFGTLYFGKWTEIKVDFRKKFWKELTNNE